jgi:hypothetical protein
LPNATMGLDRSICLVAGNHILPRMKWVSSIKS